MPEGTRAHSLRVQSLPLSHNLDQDWLDHLDDSSIWLAASQIAQLQQNAQPKWLKNRVGAAILPQLSIGSARSDNRSSNSCETLPRSSIGYPLQAFDSIAELFNRHRGQKQPHKPFHLGKEIALPGAHRPRCITLRGPGWIKQKQAV